MSDTQREVFCGISGDKGVVNSPLRMKPKNARQHAAHSMALSIVNGGCAQTAYILCKRLRVMGNLLERECCGDNLRIPFRRYSSWGKERVDGSWKPARIWWNRVAAKYERMVPELTESAREAAN